MTWVTSANSSDPWGKKYDWFIEASDLKQLEESIEEEEEDVTEEDVESFLTQTCEEESLSDETISENSLTEDEEEELLLETLETIEEPEEEVLPVPTSPPETNQWHPNQFSQQPENYVPAFNPQNINS